MASRVSKSHPFSLVIRDLDFMPHADVLQLLRTRFRVYAKKGLIDPQSGRRQRLPKLIREALATEHANVPERADPFHFEIEFDKYDLKPWCRQLVVKHKDRIIAASRVIHENDDEPLPMMELFADEVAALRRSRSGDMMELSRLVVIDDFRESRFALWTRAKQFSLQTKVADRMMMMIRRYAERFNVTDLFAQVHPVHARIYVQHGFTQLGPERAYSKVNNHPAVLLRYEVPPA